jgi:N-hydroxyarylamine O-acetyltransferase
MVETNSKMQRTLIIDGYLKALGLQKRTADLAFLNDIALRHVSQFPFSSVGPMLGDELPLDFESLYQRIVVRSRGGYCFEQNGLMYELLKELGFTVRLYLGRVIYNKDIHPGLTHRITLVEIDGSQFVVDVGFGPLGPAQTVAMSGENSIQNFRLFRVAQRRPGEYHMQTLREGEFYSLYKFELARYGQADCEVGHFYSHKHPQASFVNHLVVSRILQDEIHSLRNHEYCIFTSNDEQKRLIGNSVDLRSILDSHFGVRVTLDESTRLFEKSARNNT